MVKRKRGGRKPTRREIEVARALAQAGERGQDFDAVARRLGVRVSTVRWWASQIRCRARRRREKADAALVPAPPALVEVKVEAVAAAARFEAVLPGGREIRVPHGFDAGELSRLIAVLEQRC